MVWLLRHQTRWLVERLLELRVLPAGQYAIEQLPTETWPVGEENRSREIRADVVLRLWSGPVPEDPTLKEIRTSGVIGLILDFQERRDRDKELRLLEYDSAYPPVLGPRIFVVVLTLHQTVARWMRRVFARKQLSMQTCVLEPHQIPRSGPIETDIAPRRALLEAMLHARNDADLPLVTNALRALRHFEGNELLIYREMLLTHLKEELIMQAHLDLEYDDYDEYDDDDGRWDDYEPTEEERQSFMYRRGERAGREDGLQEGRQEGLQEGRQEALALAVVDVLRARNIELDPPTEAKILACHDDALLRAWLARATMAARASELFDPE